MVMPVVDRISFERNRPKPVCLPNPFPEEFFLVLCGDSNPIITIGYNQPVFRFLYRKIHEGYVIPMAQGIFHQVVEDPLDKGISKNLHPLNCDIDLNIPGFQLPGLQSR